ncbi:MAG: hypothetical protein SFY32_07690, partial [Bacteroidota bacterium]|nr:hypothetical protein [Bacteroidota bacterium]
QYLYWSRKWNQTKFSILAFKDDFGKYTADTVFINRNSTDPNKPASFVAGRRYGQTNDVNSRYTIGGQFNTQIGNASEGGRVLINGGGYYQGGKNRDGQNLSAYHLFGYAMYTRGKWGIGPGYDLLSGNDGEAVKNNLGKKEADGSFSYTDNRFDPLYGTPHRWWGYMDYYYVGTGAPLGGLQNIYVRAQYKAKDLLITLDVHQFTTANKLWRSPYTEAGTTNVVAGETISSNLGNEIDLVVNYQANKFVNLEAGASIYLSNLSTEVAKSGTPGMGAYAGKRNTGDFQQWGYVQLNITPDFLFQKPVTIKQ